MSATLRRPVPPADRWSVGRLATITRFVLRHRRPVVMFWVLITVVGFASVGSAVNALSDEFSVPGHEGYETNTQIERTLGNGGNTAPLVPVITLPPGVSVTSPRAQAGIGEVAARMESAVPRVRIASYTSTNNHAFVSRDGRTTFLLVYPPRARGNFGRNTEAVNQAEQALRGLHPAGGTVRLTGLDALNASSGKKGGVGLLAEGLLGGIGALVVLLFVFASVLAIVPIIMAVISIMTSFLLVWALTTVTSVSGMVSFFIALIGLGVAIDYSLLIVVRWREERAHGHDGDEAIVRAMSTAGRAVVFSGTTVAIGLLSLVVIPIPFLRSVGYSGLVIPLISVAVALTLLPIVLLKLGRRLDWPHLRTDDTASRAWTRWATGVVRHRALAAGAAVLILGALAAGAGTITLGSASGDPDTLSQTGQAKAGLTTLERSGIGNGVLSPVEIVSPSRSAATVAARAANVPGIRGAVAPVGRAWTSGRTSVVDALASTDQSSTVDRVRTAAHRVSPNVRVGGMVAQNSDFTDAVYGSFPLMLSLITVLTFVLLARAFRSLLLPLKAVILNLVSVAAAWGVVVLVWQHGFGSSAIWGIPAVGSVPSWLPLMVFAFLFGLSMDYEVFILARMREEYDATGSTDRAVVGGIGRTGRLVTSAALILFLGFVSMATASGTQVKMIATGLGAGIILDATVVRALLVPAAVALFGRWNWWLPARLARILRVDIRPDRLIHMDIDAASA